MIIRVMIDYLNQAETWWEKGGRKLWDKYSYAKDKYNYLNLDETAAREFYHAAEKIPGWENPDQHAFARYPLEFQTLDGVNVWFEKDKLVVCK